MKKSRFLALFLLLALLLPTAALALEDPAPAATAALLVDATYDEVLYELNIHEKRYPASITKVMTALLTLEAVDRGELALTDVITAPEGIHNGLSADSSTANIKSGEQMTLLDLLYCVLLPSANEACNVLAYAVSGSVDGFVALMNQRAAELGMTGTHFTNTHGLHDDNHYTTAWDIWLMSREAMKHETFREIVSTKEYTVPATNISAERLFYNTNGLITAKKYSGYIYQPAIGIKTGSTGEAGLCLVSAAEMDGRTLYCVVLGAELAHQEDNSYKRMNFVETTRLFEWGFSNFSCRTILESSEPVAQIAVTLSDTDHVLVRPEGSLSALLPKDLDVSQFTQTVTLDAESVEAPVAEGQVLGEITLSYDGREYGSLDLVALNDVERSELLYRIDRAEKFFAQTWVKAAIVALIVLILVLIIAGSVRRKRKRRRSRSYVGGGYGGRRRR
ncbi:MAG: D-alanyl-D-alanine carboxypeptidase family protein [Oscillospiraceae bacterium]